MARVPVRAVFAVTSSGRDLYSAMTRIAAASMRVSNPGVRLVVACDAQTDAALRRTQDPVLTEVDDWVVVTTPDGAPDFRNRFVRTRLRATIDGPFLFLDSDVLVRGDVSELFNLDVDLAGAPNLSRLERREQIGREESGLLALMGWDVDPDVYLNAGVLFINDTEAAHLCCTDWHARWLLSSAISPLLRDQPAMNAAIRATQPRVAVLPARFNAQFRNTISVIPGAVVWHYYASVRHPAHTRFELLARAVADGAALDVRTIRSLIRSPHPWRRATPIDDFAAARILRRDRFDGWAALWLRREFGPAIRRRSRELFRLDNVLRRR